MCGSMVDIQSAAAEIKRGIKKKEDRRQKETTGQKYIDRNAMQGGHNNRHRIALYYRDTWNIVERTAYIQARLKPNSITLSWLQAGPKLVADLQRAEI